MRPTPTQSDNKQTNILGNKIMFKLAKNELLYLYYYCFRLNMNHVIPSIETQFANREGGGGGVLSQGSKSNVEQAYNR